MDLKLIDQTIREGVSRQTSDHLTRQSRIMDHARKTFKDMKEIRNLSKDPSHREFLEQAESAVLSITNEAFEEVLGGDDE